MKLQKNNIVAALAVGALALTVALPAFAEPLLTVTANDSSSVVAPNLQENIRAGVGLKVGSDDRGMSSSTFRANMETRVVNRGDEEITRRINALTSLSARINAMIKLSGDEKSNFSTSIQDQIDMLTALKAKISADASSSAISSLKDDVKSITDSYRIFALIMPQAAIAAASDRAMTIVSMFQTIGTKLQTRITAAQASGTDVTAMQSAYTDFTAKLADAQVQAKAAVSETATLTPDNGSSTVKQSNEAALRDARAKLQVAQQDLVAARKDAGTIVKALGALKVSARVEASSSASGTHE